jgi:hypothetical protein
MANFMADKMNKSQIPMAAVFDLLTLQCDRHQQNILIDKDGNLHLIDNEVGWGLGRRRPGAPAYVHAALRCPPQQK